MTQLVHEHTTWRCCCGDVRAVPVVLWACEPSGGGDVSADVSVDASLHRSSSVCGGIPPFCGRLWR